MVAHRSLSVVVDHCLLASAYRARIRSAHARLRLLLWLRSISLMAQPPLLFKEGNSLVLPMCSHLLYSCSTLWHDNDFTEDFARLQHTKTLSRTLQRQHLIDNGFHCALL